MAWDDGREFGDEVTKDMVVDWLERFADLGGRQGGLDVVGRGAGAGRARLPRSREGDKDRGAGQGCGGDGRVNGLVWSARDPGSLETDRCRGCERGC